MNNGLARWFLRQQLRRNIEGGVMIQHRRAEKAARRKTKPRKIAARPTPEGEGK